MAFFYFWSIAKAILMKNLLYTIVAFVLVACSGDDRDNVDPKLIEAAKALADYNPIILERNGIKLTEFTDYPPLSDVKTMVTTQNQTFKMGVNNVEFSNTYFNLSERTAEEKKHGLNLFEGGQFLGVLKTNNVQQKVIGSAVEVDVSKGDNFYLCYLSRSYNLSLKNKNASFLFKINADPSGCYSETNLSDTVIALLEPRGEIKKVKSEHILLDFYLKNISLNNGNYVVVNIDGTEFTLNKWAPFIVSGLKTGKHTVSLIFKTKDGKTIEGLMPKQLQQSFTIVEPSVFDE